jgi:hypothetical protein
MHSKAASLAGSIPQAQGMMKQLHHWLRAAYHRESTREHNLDERSTREEQEELCRQAITIGREIEKGGKPEDLPLVRNLREERQQLYMAS